MLIWPEKKYNQDVVSINQVIKMFYMTSWLNKEYDFSKSNIMAL